MSARTGVYARRDIHTYIGQQAGWGGDFGDGRSFYWGHNKSRWRAIPVIERDAVKRVREACQAEVDGPGGHRTNYSLVGYLFSVPPFRALAWARKNNVGDKAHCAALAARILSRALPSIRLPCSDAWYGPSTLFIELSTKTRMQSYHEHITDITPTTLSLPEQHELDHARETLMCGTDESVKHLTSAACAMACRHQARLAIRERATAFDSTRTRVLEIGIARMLLRWSLVQNSPSPFQC